MGRLSVTTLGPQLGIVGDYNNNGVVDAADYVAWRDSVGGAGLRIAARITWEPSGRPIMIPGGRTSAAAWRPGSATDARDPVPSRAGVAAGYSP